MYIKYFYDEYKIYGVQIQQEYIPVFLRHKFWYSVVRLRRCSFFLPGSG